jgi:hypothetical protein
VGYRDEHRLIDTTIDRLREGETSSLGRLDCSGSAKRLGKGHF